VCVVVYSPFIVGLFVSTSAVDCIERLASEIVQSVSWSFKFSLRELHWLPVRQRIEFKLAVLVYKSLHGLTAPYLTDDCQLIANSGYHSLQSADVDTCIVPRTNTRLSCRSSMVLEHFASRTPSARLELLTFRQLLKTHLFKCDPGTL